MVSDRLPPLSSRAWVLLIIAVWIVLLSALILFRPSIHTTTSGVRLVPAVRIERLASSSAQQECSARNTGCARAMLALLNNERQKVGAPPLSLDWSLNHTATCPGARGHALAMAASNSIWHSNPSYPTVSWPSDICSPAMSAGQNVGASWGEGKWDSISQVHQEMLAEPHDSSTCASEVNHACNILSRSFTRVGIAFAHNAQGGWFLVETFVGP